MVKDDAGNLHDKSLFLIRKFYNFVLAKICFPEDFEETSVIKNTDQKSKVAALAKPKLTIDDLQAGYDSLFKLDLKQLKKLNVSREKALQVDKEYERFLLMKICFPASFH